ncbi:MAG: hypothetical protein Q9212_004111 [Teloschistes hypoglaucus]
MSQLQKISIILFLISFTSASLQVSIFMHFFPPVGIAEWENVPPGQCCIPHRSLIPPLERYDLREEVIWGVLQAQQLALGWGGSALEEGQTIECAGNPIARIMGPSQFARSEHPDYSVIVQRIITDSNYRAPPLPWTREFVFAASWVDLRTRLPPSGADARYLQWQGVKSLIWGKNTWTAASDGIPFPKRDHDPKLNGFASQGQATIQRPSRWIYPSSYTLNGTKYADAGDGVYRSLDGRILNTTMLS